MGYGMCNECGADIIWAFTLPGRKRMPLDPERYPADDTRANLIVGRDHLGSLFVRAESEVTEILPEQWRGMPHFATCRARQQATEQRRLDELAARRAAGGRR